MPLNSIRCSVTKHKESLRDSTGLAHRPTPYCAVRDLAIKIKNVLLSNKKNHYKYVYSMLGHSNIFSLLLSDRARVS